MAVWLGKRQGIQFVRASDTRADQCQSDSLYSAQLLPPDLARLGSASLTPRDLFRGLA